MAPEMTTDSCFLGFWGSLIEMKTWSLELGLKNLSVPEHLGILLTPSHRFAFLLGGRHVCERVFIVSVGESVSECVNV